MDKLDDITAELLKLQDLEYKNFQSKLIPTVPKENIIGVRTPVLRKFARKIRGTNLSNEFLNSLPHKYYEANNLHAILIEDIQNFDDCINALDTFLPYIDNWATCDMLSPKSFKHTQYKEKLFDKATLWTNSNHTYTVRFGLSVFLKYFLDNKLSAELSLDIASRVTSDEYYVNMMIAWLFATAMAKQYEVTSPYIENKLLPTWIHNKTIQKCVESLRLNLEQKSYLKSFRIK